MTAAWLEKTQKSLITCGKWNAKCSERIDLVLFFFWYQWKNLLLLFIRFDSMESNILWVVFNGSKIWLNWMHTTCTSLNLCVCVCVFDFAARTFFLYIIIIYVRMIISFSTKTILLHILKFIGPEEEKAICLRVCVCVCLLQHQPIPCGTRRMLKKSMCLSLCYCIAPPLTFYYDYSLRLLITKLRRTFLFCLCLMETEKLYKNRSHENHKHMLARVFCNTTRRTVWQFLNDCIRVCILIVLYGPICKFFRFIEHERINREIRIELLHTLTQISNLESAEMRRKNPCRFDTRPALPYSNINSVHLTTVYADQHVTSYMGKHFHMFFISPTALLPSIEHCVRARALSTTDGRTDGPSYNWMIS